MTLAPILAALAMLQAPDADRDSRVALTIYSAADPASFDPRSFAAGRARFQFTQFGGMGGQGSLPGYGIVREIRSIDLDEGLNAVRFADVAAGIDPTTVSFRSVTAPEATTVLEQSFEYDLVNSAKLFERYLDRPITIHRESPSGRRSTLTAPLLAREGTSGSGGQLIMGAQGEGDPIRIIPLDDDIVEIELPAPGDGLVTEPTLVWSVACDRPGRHDVEVGYQTGGLTWRADYNLVVSPDETTADLSSWVSILNESGASYDDARLKLVAGDVQRIEPQVFLGGGMGGMGGGFADDQGFEEKPFFEYHLYTLGRPTSLPDRSTKQIELFPTRPDVGIETVYVYYGAPSGLRFASYDDARTNRALGTDGNTDVDVYLKIPNDEAHGLGLPLPAGRVRVYKRDEADGAPEFVGEDVIGHTPRDEEILARLGSAFDLVGERRQVDFRRDGNVEIRETFEISVRNHKDRPVEVQIREVLYRWLNWEIVQCSHDFEKQDSRTIHIPVAVPAGGETTVLYTVRYTIDEPRGGFR